MDKLFFILFILFCTVKVSEAQEVVSAQGSSYSNATIQVDFTIGEVENSTFTLEGGDITAGFQQGYLLVTGIENKESRIEVNVFPNPVADKISIEKTSVSGSLNYSLYNELGVLVDLGSVKETLTFINVSQLSNGLYILSIYDNVKEDVRKFKIIKK